MRLILVLRMYMLVIQTPRDVVITKVGILMRAPYIFSFHAHTLVALPLYTLITIGAMAFFYLWHSDTGRSDI